MAVSFFELPRIDCDSITLIDNFYLYRMKQDLQIILVQYDIAWEAPMTNKKHLEAILGQLPKDTDLVVLPEMFTTGFTMTPAVHAETMNGPTMQWLQQWSAQLNAAICGSIIIKDEEAYYNRFVFMSPSGEVSSYDKRHLFNMAGEGEQYTPGSDKKIIEYQGWKILPQICYDLRFPVFSRNTQNYDLMIYVANWPKTRVAAWDTLLQARAIENMSYAIGVNRIGRDANELDYVGHSAAYNLLGEKVSEALAATTTHIANVQLYQASLSKELISVTRSKLPFLQDRDDFSLTDL